MTEKQITEYREYLKTLGSVPGLDSIRALCGRLGNPQDALSFVHIAGTNGKGSVGTFLSYGLAAAGLRVGRFVSPVLTDEREAFLLLEKKKVSGGVAGRPKSAADFEIRREMISGRSYGTLLEQVADAGKAMEEQGLAHPTAFEVDTALGFLWFLQKKCDIVVLECGMGGRLDSTNVVKNTLMEVITPIGLEHTQFLGDTPEKIAFQKAGIIKSGSLVVSAPQEAAVTSVLREECEKQAAEFVVADPGGISKVTRKETAQSFTADGKLRLTISLAGAYQVENAYLAYAALRELRGRLSVQNTKVQKTADLSGTAMPESDKLQKLRERLTKHLDDEAIRVGFAAATWPGRFQILRKKPYLVLDGAHNVAGAKALAESLKLYFPNRRIVYIMGVFRDKDVSGMIKETAALASQILTVRLPDANRSMDAVTLAKEVAKVNPNVTSADGLQEALEMAYLLAGKDGVIVVFGSLSHLGGVIKMADLPIKTEIR